MALRDSKLWVQTLGQTALSENCGQLGGQFVTDSKLQIVIDAWPNLNVLWAAKDLERDWSMNEYGQHQSARRRAKFGMDLSVV